MGTSGAEYDPGKGIFATAFSCRSTVVPGVMLRAEFYLFLGINLSFAYSAKTGWYDPGELHLSLDFKITALTGSLMTFFVIFYNGSVFSRYLLLDAITKNMNDNCVYIASTLVREIPDKALVRILTRWLMCSILFFFFNHTREKDGDTNTCAVSEREWKQLSNLGLLNPRELQALKAHCDRMKQHAMPGFMLLHWSMKLYRKKLPRIRELDAAYIAVRKCQEDIQHLMDLPIPFQYFHMMNLMMLLNLCLWAYSFAVEDSYFASVIFMFVQLMFQGMRELSVSLSDPYGSDDTDFALKAWISQLYVRTNAIIEGTVVQDEQDELHLLKLKLGEDVVELLVDERAIKERKEKATKVGSKALGGPTGGSRGSKDKNISAIGEGEKEEDDGDDG